MNKNSSVYHFLVQLRFTFAVLLIFFDITYKIMRDMLKI